MSIVTAVNEVWGKVMFLHLSVILFTGGQVSAPLHAGIHPYPLGRHPPFRYYGIRSTRGRYASYWNAYLFEPCFPPDTMFSFIIKPHSHERQRLRLRVRLRQIANIASMGCVKCKEEWVLHPFFAFDATSSLTQCYHLDANAHADANVDARVNGPLELRNLGK